MSKASDHTVAELFVRKPKGQWDARGNVYLWTALLNYFNGVPLPDSEIHLPRMLHEAFQEITHHDVEEKEMFYMKEFDPGSGMSAGVISPLWWKKTGFEIVNDRAWALGVYPLPRDQYPSN